MLCICILCCVSVVSVPVGILQIDFGWLYRGWVVLENSNQIHRISFIVGPNIEAGRCRDETISADSLSTVLLAERNRGLEREGEVQCDSAIVMPPQTL